MKYPWILALTLFAAVAWSGAAEAPQPPPQKSADTKAPIAKQAEVRQLIEEVMIARITKELGLNDEQTVLIVRRFSEYRDKAREARQQRKKLVDEMKEDLRSGDNSAQVGEKLKAILALDVQIAQDRTAAFESVATSLTPQQQGKLYLFLADFEVELRRMAQAAKEGGPGLGGNGARPGGAGKKTGPEKGQGQP